MRRLLILPFALIGLQSVALAFHSVSSLNEVAQEAELITHGRVVELLNAGPGADGEYTGSPFAKLEVLKTIHGKSGKHIYVIMGDSIDDNTSLLVDQEYILFLKRIDVTKDEYLKEQYDGAPVDKTYMEINFGHTVIHIKNGLAHFRKEMRIGERKNLSKLLGKRTMKEVVEAIFWLKGPKMSVASSRKSVRCGGQIEFAVTLTNNSPLHMELKFADANAKIRYGGFGLELIDEHGFSVLRSKTYSGAPDGEDSEKRLTPEVVGLKPGGSVQRKVSFYVPLFNYLQNPSSVRRARLSFYAHSHRSWSNDIDHRDIYECWTGETTGECAVDISCGMSEWVATLARPGKQWQYRLACRPFDVGENFTQAAPQRGKKVLFQAVKQRYTGGYSYLMLKEDQRRALSSYFQITRNGAVVQRASDSPDDMLEILSSEASQRQCSLGKELDLADYVDLSIPGDYKIRFRLKESGKLAWSNEITVRVPERKIVDLVTVGEPDEGRAAQGSLVLTARADKGVFLCDEPVDFRVGFENVGDKDIKLKCVPEGASNGKHFDLRLLDKNGCGVLRNWDVYIGFGNDALCVIKPGKRIERTIRFHVPIGKYFGDPEEVKCAEVKYRPRDRADGAWNGILAVKCPVRVVNPYAEWGEELARSEGRWRCNLRIEDCSDYVTVAAPGKDLWLALAVWGGKRSELPEQKKPAPEMMRQLGSYLEVTKDGRTLKSPNTDPSALRKAFARHMKTRHRVMTGVLNLAEHVGLEQPGLYRVRFRVTEAGAVSESNVLTIKVPKRSRRR